MSVATRLLWQSSATTWNGSSYQGRSLSWNPRPASSSSNTRELWTLSAITARDVRLMNSRIDAGPQPRSWPRSPPEVNQLTESAIPSTAASWPVLSR